MKKPFAAVWYILGAILLAIPLPALMTANYNYALYFSSICGILCLLLPWLSRRIRRRSKRIYVICRAVFLTLFFFVITLFSAVSAVMASYAYFPPTAPQGEDLIILGCGIDGEKPSLMLQYRLDTAAEYLLEYPDARTVCCGGIGKGKQMSEAEVMRNYLVSKGVDADRIMLDEQSTSTEENLSYAAEIISKNGGSGRYAVCTNDFHIYRACSFASKAGLSVVPLTAPTPDFLFLAYWVRELFGITRMWILGF